MSENVLTLVAIVKVKPERRDFARAQMLQLLAPTQAEEGCLEYVFHDHNSEPNTFVFYERWISHDALQKHMNSTHFQAFVQATEGAVESLQFHELTKATV